MGKRVKLSNGRRLVDDVIEIGCKQPTAGLSGQFDVTKVSQFRRLTSPRIAWNVLYMKAFSIIALDMPELRRAYVRFPWRHLYEHNENVCMMTVSRKLDGEERLFFARFNCPDQRSLLELQQQYEMYRRAPIDQIKQFRHQINFAKFPSPIRRMCWWALFNLWPSKRAGHMGTFGMSLAGYKGSYGNKHLGPNTTTVGVDPLPRKGMAHSMLTFDHRVMDGIPATRVLQRMHEVLSNRIRLELAELAGVHPVTAEPFTSAQIQERKANQLRIEAERQQNKAA